MIARDEGPPSAGMNRRHTLRALLGAAAATIALPLRSIGLERKVEKRLLGTWRSDKERTIKQWCYPNELSAEKRRRFENIFGKFTLRFTPTHIYTEYDGDRQVIAYSVVASDANSVVVAWHEKSNSLQQIHFEKSAYYVVSGYNIEFFKRVAPNEACHTTRGFGCEYGEDGKAEQRHPSSLARTTSTGCCCPCAYNEATKRAMRDASAMRSPVYFFSN